MNRRKRIGILLVVIWMVVIFSFSHQPADTSSEISGSISDQIVTEMNEILDMDWGRNQVLQYAKWIEMPVRKAAHMTEYAILAILLLHMLTALWEQKVPFQKKWYGIAIGLSACYASTDEFHQLFIEGRSGQVRDVLIDTAGAAIGMLLAFLVLQLYNKRVKNKK